MILPITSVISFFLMFAPVPGISKDCRNLGEFDVRQSAFQSLANCNDGVLIASGTDIRLDLRYSGSLSTVQSVLENARQLKIEIRCVDAAALNQQPWTLDLSHLESFEALDPSVNALVVERNAQLLEIRINASWTSATVHIRGNRRLSLDSLNALRAWAAKSSVIQKFGECVLDREPVSDVSMLEYCVHIASDFVIHPLAPQDIPSINNSIKSIEGCLRINNTALDNLDFLDLDNGLKGKQQCSNSSYGYSEISYNSNLCVFPKLGRLLVDGFSANIHDNKDSSCHSTCLSADLLTTSGLANIVEKEIVCLTLIGDVVIRGYSAKQPWFKYLENVETIMNGSLIIEKNNLSSIMYFRSLKYINLTTAGVAVLVANNTNLGSFDLPNLISVAPTLDEVPAIRILDNHGLDIPSSTQDRYEERFPHDFDYRPYRNYSKDDFVTEKPKVRTGTLNWWAGCIAFCILLSISLYFIITAAIEDYYDYFHLPEVIAEDPEVKDRLSYVVSQFIDFTCLEHRQRHGRNEDRQLRYDGPKIHRGGDYTRAGQISKEVMDRHASKIDIIKLYAGERLSAGRFYQILSQMKKIITHQADFHIALAGYPDPAWMILGLAPIREKYIYLESYRKEAECENGVVIKPAVRDIVQSRLLDTEIFNDHLTIYHYDIFVKENGVPLRRKIRLVNFTGWVYRNCPHNPTTLLSLIALAKKQPITFLCHANASIEFGLIAIDSIYLHITRPDLPRRSLAEVNQLVAYSLGIHSMNTKICYWTMNMLIHWAARSGCLPRNKGRQFKHWKVVWSKYYSYIDRIPAAENPNPVRLKIQENILDLMKERGLMPTLPRTSWAGTEPVAPRPVAMYRAAGMEEGPDVYAMFHQYHPEEIEFPSRRMQRRIDKALRKWKRRHGGEQRWTMERYMEAASGSLSDQGEDGEDERLPVHNIFR